MSFLFPGRFCPNFITIIAHFGQKDSVFISGDCFVWRPPSCQWFRPAKKVCCSCLTLASACCSWCFFIDSTSVLDVYKFRQLPQQFKSFEHEGNCREFGEKSSSKRLSDQREKSKIWKTCKIHCIWLYCSCSCGLFFTWSSVATWCLALLLLLLLLCVMYSITSV